MLSTKLNLTLWGIKNEPQVLLTAVAQVTDRKGKERPSFFIKKTKQKTNFNRNGWKSLDVVSQMCNAASLCLHLCIFLKAYLELFSNIFCFCSDVIAKLPLV